MEWTTILEKEQFVLRVDEVNKNAVLEVNSGGFTPKYVTLYLVKKDVEDLIYALHNVWNRLNKA